MVLTSRPTLAFLEADVSVCMSVFRADSVAPEDRFDPRIWVEDLGRRGKEAHFAESAEDLEDYLCGECRKGDVVVFMSSGNLSIIINKLRLNLKVRHE